jgi:hypothetical protein
MKEGDKGSREGRHEDRRGWTSGGRGKEMEGEATWFLLTL